MGLPTDEILSLEPERLENRLASGGPAPAVGIGLPHALKLLAAVLMLLDRSVLLSSKSVKQSPPSCAPRSGAPSLVSFPWPLSPDRNLPTDRRRSRFVSPRS